MASITSPSFAAGPSQSGSPTAVSSHDSLIDLKEVCRRTGLGRTTIQTKILAGTFPRRVKVGDRATRWSAKAVEQWIQDRIAASTGPGL